jgi:hypothetical protein
MKMGYIDSFYLRTNKLIWYIWYCGEKFSKWNNGHDFEPIIYEVCSTVDWECSSILQLGGCITMTIYGNTVFQVHSENIIWCVIESNVPFCHWNLCSVWWWMLLPMNITCVLLKLSTQFSIIDVVLSISMNNYQPFLFEILQNT